jgi:hypothetical protein
MMGHPAGLRSRHRCELPIGSAHNPPEDQVADRKTRALSPSTRIITATMPTEIRYGSKACRDRESAQILFRRALRHGAPQPRVINTDLAPTYPTAIIGLKRSGVLRRRCKHRPVQYLNNIIEQDHRAIKQRVNAKQGFRAFGAATRTVDGYEAMH